MKRICAVFLLLALLAGCSAPAQPPAESVDSSSAPKSEQTLLTPYLGAVNEQLQYSSRLYGLMTIQGEIVTEAVYESIFMEEYSGESIKQRVLLPVWTLHRQGPGWPNNQEFVALYAEDGSWQTDFIYHGCIGTPYGLFVGNERGAFLLDLENGQELKSWTWEELQITEPATFPWITNDVYDTAQWTGERLFLGDRHQKALMLDLETDEVEVISAAEWNAIQNERYNWSQHWEWEANIEEETVTVAHKEQENVTKTEFQVPYEAYYAVANAKDGVPRVNVFGAGTCAVYTPEGKEIIPPQSGDVWVLGYRDMENWGFNVQDRDGGTVKLYDWDGNLKFTLPTQSEAYVNMNGSLIQITDYKTRAGYYDPKTGELVKEFLFQEAVQLTSYLGGEDKFGLMTAEGEAVTEPVCDLVYQAGYYGFFGDVTRMPVWVLRQKGDLYDKYALAAGDGSWRTDFIYSGCAPTPYGIFAGKNNDQEFVWVDLYTGEESEPIPQSQYGMKPENIVSWPVNTYMRYGSQWTGERFYLEYFESKEQMEQVRRVLIDWPGEAYTPVTGAEWEELQEQRAQHYQMVQADWSAEMEGDTVYLWLDGDQENWRYAMVAPVSGTGAPLSPQIVGESGNTRVLFTDFDQSGMVYALEGDNLLYSEDGYVTAIGEESFLQYSGQYDRAYPRYFCKHGKTEAQIYDWDGNLLSTVSCREGTDTITVSYNLIQVTDHKTYAAYYDPKTGEKIVEFAF